MKDDLKKILEDPASDPAAVIAKVKDWKLHMQWSPLRASILNWYEFDPNSSLLEWNAGYGALTGLFCDRCRQVTAVVYTDEEAEVLSKRYKQRKNLRILKGNCREILKERFDYVVALGELEQAEEPAAFLKEWMEVLKPEGSLLFTVENRYGLKYFCGARDPHTGLPFDGVNGYFCGRSGKGRCLSRQEVLSAIEQAGDFKYKFYYPVPDSRMPQMIFTDDYRKGVNTAERLVDYNYEDSAMLGVEHRMFCEMIDSGALPFLANSFLIELTKQGNLSDILYAVTTTDRGAFYGTATTIRKSGVVKKRPLWPQGAANIRKLHDYTEELAGRGIPIVRTELEEDAYGLVLGMPYIEEEGLSPVLKRLAAQDQKRFVEIFDEIYGYILAASEPVENGKGAYGLVMKKAYLDLAPCNCFYRKEKGELLFYDQEFVLENCPAQFAMFRTLKYCYASAREIEESVPLRTLYERYGIREEMLEEFERKEAKFLHEVRNTENYAAIFQWAVPDYDAIYSRMEKLGESALSKEENPERKPYHIGYVPGVFDLFHTGHLNLLERCKSRCDYLIVGVLTDELVEYYKGRRTVISYEDRARVIQALSVVDEVIPVDFSNTDKLDAWNQLHYDCHFSGSDHQNHWNDVWEELKKRGSNMEFFPYTQGISSTQIREKMKT